LKYFLVFLKMLLRDFLEPDRLEGSANWPVPKNSQDFSEVEFDPFIYQFSPYENYQQENRPFFSEGSQYFGGSEFRRYGPRSEFNRKNGDKNGDGGSECQSFINLLAGSLACA
jgi:hypothetical protein